MDLLDRQRNTDRHTNIHTHMNMDTHTRMHTNRHTDRQRQILKAKSSSLWKLVNF